MRLVALAIAVLSIGACAAEDPTGILVVVDGDADVRREIDGLEATIRGGDERPDVISGTRLVSFDRDDWPVLIGIEPRRGDASRVWGLELWALQGDSGLIVHRIQGGFEEGRVKVLHVTLQWSCRQVYARSCPGADQTCIDGECRPVRHVDPSTLPDLMGDPRRDGGIDGGAECTSVAECDDADACTTDSCTGGVCANVERTCADDGNPCTTAECDAADGECAHLAVPEGASCGGTSLCCGGACADVTSDPSACGACGTVCGANQECAGGTCVCKEGFSDCDGDGASCEARLASDPLNCGSCGNACGAATPACIHSMCDRCVTDADCPEFLECIEPATCDADGRCVYSELSPGWCLILGECHRAGDMQPGERCRECDPAMRLTFWVDSPLGESCEDGNPCTIPDTCDGTGACQSAERVCTGTTCTTASCDVTDGTCHQTLISCPASTGSCSTSTHCVIDGTCYGDEQPHPANACQYCLPSSSHTRWTDRPNGLICGSGRVCSSGTCVTADAGPTDAGSDAGTGGS